MGIDKAIYLMYNIRVTEVVMVESKLILLQNIYRNCEAIQVQ